ncbi:MAG: zinc ribbon domain-containing protein [Acutalibacteraceae bacterium]
MKKKLSMILAVLMLMLCLPVSSVATEETKAAELPANLFTVKITEAQAFSNNYAWIRYINENDVEVYALANISGEIVYSLPEGVEVSKLWSYQDGFAAYRVGEKYDSSYDVVIDAAGNEYFHTESTDQRVEHLLAWGDGIFMFSLDEENMTETTYSYIGKTADGVVKYTLEDKPSYWENDWRYVGEGWYANENYPYAVSLSRGKMKDDGDYIYGEFHNGEILGKGSLLWGNTKPYTRLNSNLDKITDCDYRGDFQLGERDYVEDGYYVYNSNYIDNYPIPSVRRWNGEIVFELTKYTNNTTQLYPFCGDFAPYEIDGKDGHKYLTAVDWEGNEVFAPRDLTANGEKIAKNRLYNDHFLIKNSDGDYVLMNLKQEYVHNISKDFPGCAIADFTSYTQGQLIIKFKDDKGTYFKYYSVKDAIAAGSNRYAAAVSEQQGTTAEETPSEDNTSGILVSYAGASVKFRNSLFEKSACEYDNDLAILGGILSCAAEKSEQDLIDLLQTMEVNGYDPKNFGENEMFAFAIAHKKMQLDGKDTTVLFIIARGTVNPYEAFSDYVGKTDPFFNYTAYNYAKRFYLRINDGISDYMENFVPDLTDAPFKVFVTGHSLGGAGANLVAANFKLYDWWSNYLNPTEDVFAYTYGAIDSIKVDAPVTTGFNNIHNIYNFYDTFGPNGRPFLTASGNSGKGRFGHIDQFANIYTTDPFSYANHEMENYLHSIMEGAIQCKSPRSGSSVWGPVDIEVLRDGAVVGRIVDNQVDEELLAANPEVALMVVEDSKHIAVFDNPEAYSLRITATDDGEMSVSTMSFDDTGESYGAAEYPDVAIKTGQVFSMELPVADSVGSAPQTPELLLMDGDRISGKVNADGSITPVSGTENGLQLALLAVVAILGVLITFLGGRKMKKTKKLKFPIASIFTALLALGLIENLRSLLLRAGMLDQMIGYRMVVEFGSTHSVPHILYQILLIGSMVLLTVLLFMRKRNGLLSGALAMQALLPVFTLVSFLLNSGSRGFFETYEYELHFGPKMWAIGICGCYVLESLCYLLLTLMTITPCAEDGKHKRGLHRLWFLPGILGIFIAFAHLVGNIYFKRSDLYCLSILFLIPMAFLLGWWLTHPYKKERPVYQMPIAQPYGQPVYQNVSTFDAAQKGICINCGRELLSDELFCAGCGTRRPEQLRAEPDQAEQKVFCSGCGRELPPDEDFCGACGTKRPTIKGSDHTEQGNHIEL